MPKIDPMADLVDVSSVIIPTRRQQAQRDGVNKLTEGVADTKRRQAELRDKPIGKIKVNNLNKIKLGE